MRLAILCSALCLLLLAGLAPGFEQADNRITLTPAEAAACAAEGGCLLITAEKARQVQMLIEARRMCLRES